MENQEKGLTINIENYSGEKPIEVVYRKEKLHKPSNRLQQKHPKVLANQV